MAGFGIQPREERSAETGSRRPAGTVAFDLEVRVFRARAMLRRRLFDRVIQSAPEAFQFLDARCDRVVENVLNRIGG